MTDAIAAKSPNGIWDTYGDVQNLATTRSGVGDLLEAGITGLAWCDYFKPSPGVKNAINTLEPMEKGLAIPALFSHLNDFRRNIVKIGNSDEWEPKIDAISSLSLATASASKATTFLDSANIVSLKQGVKDVARGTFWGAVVLHDGIDFFKQMGNEEALKKKKESAKPEMKWLYNHKLALTYLTVLQDITTIAMGCLTLISLIFSSISSSLIFSPIVFLSLGTLWVVLNMVNYFYGRILDREEAAIPSYKRV